jgi:hypothetical protein
MLICIPRSLAVRKGRMPNGEREVHPSAGISSNVHCCQNGAPMRQSTLSAVLALTHLREFLRKHHAVTSGPPSHLH